MLILIAPQEFKGSLTAAQAAAAMASGARDARPGAALRQLPMSDGGPGLVDALLSASGGDLLSASVHDPLMRPIDAAWARLSVGGAAIEMAAASGLVLVSPGERDALVATTYGAGELILAALDAGCRSIVVGVGGSATVDGGAGAMQALGTRLLDGAGDDLPPGGGPLARLARIDLPAVDARVREARIRVASDVTSTLCGPAGAARMFGPQKGASPADVEILEAALHHFAAIVARDCGVDVLPLPGGGAAGGLAAGLVAVAGATIEPGFALVAEAVGLDAAVAAADVVVTGEGRLDAQTAYGKTVSGVAALARKHGKRVVAIVGSVDPAYHASAGDFDALETLSPPGAPSAEAMRDAAALLRAATGRALASLRA